ncbi:MAG TPA: hypothetical protein VFF06_29995 [Polyangia bacterium]|nr:hypothetical protein [Polyangia bacterium]
MEQRTSGAGSGTNNGNIGAKTRELADEAQQQLEDLRERFGEVNERVMGFIRERPGTSILIALGCGYLIGRILRS